MLSKHLEWAKNNKDTDEGKNFLDLASLYCRHADSATYGLLMAVADEIEKLMCSRVEGDR